MQRQTGTTMLELITVMVVIAVFAGIVVPSASRARAAVSAGEAARRLALVLRTAQAQAQDCAGPIRVEVRADGGYSVRDGAGFRLAAGDLGARISSTYPGGVLEFSARGWAGLPGTGTPRAGHFGVEGTGHTVTVQLSGCVRCA
jgi:type II secretory pathway pseudopilin PulG